MTCCACSWRGVKEVLHQAKCYSGLHCEEPLHWSATLRIVNWSREVMSRKHLTWSLLSHSSPAVTTLQVGRQWDRNMAPSVPKMLAGPQSSVRWAGGDYLCLMNRQQVFINTAWSLGPLSVPITAYNSSVCNTHTRPIKTRSPLLYPSTSAFFSPPPNGAEKKGAPE